LLETPERQESSEGGRHHRSGGTLLYDAVYLASNDMMKKLQGRKAVIILSDGVDRGSKESLSSAIESAQRANTVVYSILFKDDQQYGSRGGFGGGGRGGGGRHYPRQEEQRSDGKKILAGVDLALGSTVPIGSGLSSSAALEVALLRAIRQSFALHDLDDVNLALLGQKAENDFVGARCGIMDQMAASLADQTTALFLDTRSLEFRRVPLPATADLVVVHSGVSHGIAGGEYNTRRAECEEAARQLGVPQLRDLTRADLARIEQEYGVKLSARFDSPALAGLIEREGSVVRLAPGRLSISNEVFVELLR